MTLILQFKFKLFLNLKKTTGNIFNLNTSLGYTYIFEIW